jgi:hypothetical protein
MGQAPEPRPGLGDYVRTALARAIAGGELRAEALSQAELTALRATGFSAAARRMGHAAITSRLGAAQLAASGTVVTKLVDGWLDDLERILGEITDAVIDPRFVEGVIVENREGVH